MPRKSAEQSSSSRLETQIHRRKKARPFSPLLPEWEKHDSIAPSGWTQRLWPRRLSVPNRIRVGLPGLRCRSFVRLLSRQPRV